MRFAVFLLVILISGAAYAQRDSTVTKITDSLGLVSTLSTGTPILDSAALAKASREQFLADSFAMIYLRPDPLRKNQFISKVFKDNLSIIRSIPMIEKHRFLKSGQPRTTRDPWVIGAIIGLLIYTALLNLLLNADIKNVIQSFYNKHALSQLDKEGGLINSWAFIGLFILFSLTFGLVLYQLTIYNQVYYSIGGFQLFISLAAVTGLLFAFKFILLKFIGYVFNVNRLVSQYISILNLTYFNIAFVLLAVAICFSLLASRFIPSLLFSTLVLIIVIFVWQYLRNSVNIISNFRLHKFYLFIYLCALEICPILILIKALNI